MNKILSLSLSKQTAILSFIILILAFVSTIFCFFIGHRDIPLGILLGGTVSIIPYLLFSYKEDTLSPRRSMKFAIIIIILMSVLHIIALVLAALLTFVAKVQIFNLFATFGGIFIGLISNVIVNIIDGRRKCGQNC